MTRRFEAAPQAACCLFGARCLPPNTRHPGPCDAAEPNLENVRHEVYYFDQVEDT